MIKKIENWLFYLFLFAIPISVRHIFHYEPFQFVEWTAVYVYATDLLLVGLLGFWLHTKPKIKIKRADWFLFAFVVVAGISIKNAIDTNVAIFQWLKLLEGVALYFYIKDYVLKRFQLSKGFVALVATGAFQGVVAIAQFMTQGSLGLKYLGESVLAPALSGIAAFYVHGIKIMRAYGTVPHSNVLAVFLFVTLGAFYSIAIYQRREWWWHVLHAIILWAFLLTFSRVVIGLWVLNFLVRAFLIRFHKPFHKEFWQDEEMRHRSLRIFWVTVGVCAVFAVSYWPYVLNRSEVSTTDEAVQMRVFYNHESLQSRQELFGLGTGNFVPWLMTQNLHLDRGLYQPVHNIYLLIYSETGPIGLGLFLVFLGLLMYDYYQRTGFRKLYHFSFALIIFSILIFGLFDHYLWTIQSGRLLFWLALALAAGAE